MEGRIMNRPSVKLEEIFAAIAFAEEAGSADHGASNRRAETIETIFTAISFAEAGVSAYTEETMASGSGDNYGPSAHCHDGERCFCMGSV